MKTILRYLSLWLFKWSYGIDNKKQIKGGNADARKRITE